MWATGLPSSINPIQYEAYVTCITLYIQWSCVNVNSGLIVEKLCVFGAVHHHKHIRVTFVAILRYMYLDGLGLVRQFYYNNGPQ